MKEEINKILEKDQGFFHQNHYQLEEVSSDKVVLKAPITKEIMNIYHMAHGGFIFGLGDHAMGILASMDKKKALTINASINYLSPGIGEYLIAEAEYVKKGNKTCFLQAKIYNNDKKLVATMTSTYYYIED